MSRAAVNLLFRALSDSTRLRILLLHLLKGGEVCVGDLVRVLRVSQPTASRHLAYLRRAKFVNARKNGLWMFDSLAPGSHFHERLLACLESCREEMPRLAKDEARLAQIKRGGDGCCP